VTLARVPAPPKGSIQRTVSPSRGAVGGGVSVPRVPAAPFVALLVLLAVAAGGYAIGASGRHSDSEAASARRTAQREAFAAAQRDLTARGRRDGLRAGTASGSAAGRIAGKRAGATTSKANAAPAPGQIKDCHSPIRQKSFVSSVKGIACAAAAAEQLGALKAGHPTRTAKGFTCQRLDPKHYRCTKGALAYRWDISP
jgi:hypothetical protein